MVWTRHGCGTILENESIVQNWLDIERGIISINFLTVRVAPFATLGPMSITPVALIVDLSNIFWGKGMLPLNTHPFGGFCYLFQTPLEANYHVYLDPIYHTHVISVIFYLLL